MSQQTVADMLRDASGRRERRLILASFVRHSAAEVRVRMAARIAEHQRVAATSECRCGAAFGGRSSREAIRRRKDHEREVHGLS